MAEYSIVADITQALIKLLREKMCPDVVRAPETILAISPADKNTDFLLGVFLYNTTENGNYPQVERVPENKSDLRFPPRVLDLHYMLYTNPKAYSGSGSGLIDEQKLLAKVMQVLFDYPRIQNDRLPSAALFQEDDAFISFDALNFEEKARIWTALNIPYQNAVYVQVSPVMLSSEKVQKVSRVTHADFSAVEKTTDAGRN